MQIRATDPDDRAVVLSVLARYPAGTSELLQKARCSVYVLNKKEAYRTASAGLRRLGIDVDSWPAPPAGLFVVEERTVYIRSVSEMTIGHELGHAVDLALGEGAYLSGVDPEIRRAFSIGAPICYPLRRVGAGRILRGGRKKLLRTQRCSVALAEGHAGAPPPMRSRTLRDYGETLHSHRNVRWAACRGDTGSKSRACYGIRARWRRNEAATSLAP